MVQFLEANIFLIAGVVAAPFFIVLFAAAIVDVATETANAGHREMGIKTSYSEEEEDF